MLYRSIVLLSLLGCLSWFAVGCAPETQSLGATTMFGHEAAPQMSSPTRAVGNVLPTFTPYYELLLMDNPIIANRPKRNLPKDVKRAIRKTGFPLYKGSSPPAVDGFYDVLGTVDVVNNVPYLGKGLQLYHQLSFWGQGNGLINMVEHYTSLPGQVYITGKNNNFTIYIKVNYFDTNTCDLWALISGTKTSTGLQTTMLRTDSTTCGPKAWVTIQQTWTRNGPAQTQTVPQ